MSSQASRPHGDSLMLRTGLQGNEGQEHAPAKLECEGSGRDTVTYQAGSRLTNATGEAAGKVGSGRQKGRGAALR